MKVPHATLAEQRTQLLERIAAERGAMTASLTVWRQPMAWVDLGRSVGRFVRAHPLAVAAGYALESVTPTMSGFILDAKVMTPNSQLK